MKTSSKEKAADSLDARAIKHGRETERHDIACRMLDLHLPISVVVKATLLSESEVRSLACRE